MGATALLRHIRAGRHKPTAWLAALLERKPPKLVAVALANRMPEPSVETDDPPVWVYCSDGLRATAGWWPGELTWRYQFLGFCFAEAL